jgi:hypothetical protein
MNTTPQTPTPAELKNGISILTAVAEAIRELGEIPSGTLYALLVGRVTKEGYDRMLVTLTNAGLIEVQPNFMIRWVGPQFEKAA